MWLNRIVCERNEDGTVTFVDDITNEELRQIITLLLQQEEEDRQRRLRDYCNSEERAKRLQVLDKLVEEAQEMGFYDNPPKM